MRTRIIMQTTHEIWVDILDFTLFGIVSIALELFTAFEYLFWGPSQQYSSQEFWSSFSLTNSCTMA